MLSEFSQESRNMIKKIYNLEDPTQRVDNKRRPAIKQRDLKPAKSLQSIWWLPP
jgi:hypothetical protein